MLGRVSRRRDAILASSTQTFDLNSLFIYILSGYVFINDVIILSILLRSDSRYVIFIILFFLAAYLICLFYLCSTVNMVN